MRSHLHILRRPVVIHRTATHIRVGVDHLRGGPELDDAYSGTCRVRSGSRGLDKRRGRDRLILRDFEEAPDIDGTFVNDVWYRIRHGTTNWGCNNGQCEAYLAVLLLGESSLVYSQAQCCIH